jgi:hypothetical protein
MNAPQQATGVYTVQGEHPTTPGVPLLVCATLERANAEAAELVNLIAKDSDLEVPNATPENWEAVLFELQDFHGAENCWVDVTGREVLP